MTDLIMLSDQTDSEDERIDGDRVVIATITDSGEIVGPMGQEASRLLGLRLLYGATGGEFRVSVTQPWTLAYALSTNNEAFMRARIEKTGPVIAELDGEEIPVPDRFASEDEEGVVY